jgi:hypothetical protein
LIYEGDALFHIAYFGETDTVAEQVEEFTGYFNNDNHPVTT